MNAPPLCHRGYGPVYQAQAYLAEFDIELKGPSPRLDPIGIGPVAAATGRLYDVPA